MSRRVEWTDEQNVVAVGLALVEAQKPGSFDLLVIRQLVGPGQTGVDFPEQRWGSLVRELAASLSCISPAVQEHCRTSYDKSKRLCMVSKR